ncbi:MAG: LLM class flavin-dependent oxidoreductase [Candidatus Hermodarchaeota archaeon]
MKIGLQIYNYGWPGSPQNIGKKLGEIGKIAELAGFASLWVMDHFFQLEGAFGPPEVTRVDAPVLEAYSTISYLAALTKHIKVGILVTGNTFRHPGILIKTVTTLDVLSGGRAYLGIGAGGGMIREALGLGVPLFSVRERFERLEETLQIAKQMWKGNQSPFEGKHYQLTEPFNSPPPLSQPCPPILIGGDGEKKLLRLIAMYADAFNFHIGTPLEKFPPYIREWYHKRNERLTRKLKKLKEYCDDVGRSYEEIERTVLATIKLAPKAMKPLEVLELCRELAEIDIQHVIFNMPNSHEIEPLKIIGREIIPKVADL